MRILIATDNRLQEQEIDLCLRAAGHTVYGTDSGEEAIDLARIYTYDLFVLGDRTIDTSTLLLIRQLRDAKVTAPIIVIGGQHDVEAKCRLFRQGADDHLMAPFHKDELVARVAALIRRSQGHAADIIRVGGISFDLNGAVLIHGKSVHLTGHERTMLELLVRRAGQNVKKDAFMTALYDGRIDDPEIKIVDVFICKLRKKLTDAGLEKNTIKTVWGIGYRIDLPQPAALAA